MSCLNILLVFQDQMVFISKRMSFLFWNLNFYYESQLKVLVFLFLKIYKGLYFWYLRVLKIFYAHETVIEEYGLLDSCTFPLSSVPIVINRTFIVYGFLELGISDLKFLFFSRTKKSSWTLWLNILLWYKETCFSSELKLFLSKYV